MAEFGDMLLKGDKANRSTVVDVDARIITVMATLKESKTSPSSLYFRWEFDLSDAPDDLIWLTAARGFVIDKQSDARNDDAGIEEYADRVFTYPDDFTRSRKAAKPSEKSARAYMTTLSAAERLELVETMALEEAIALEEAVDTDEYGRPVDTSEFNDDSE